jgi:hypothetical protein
MAFWVAADGVSCHKRAAASPSLPAAARFTHRGDPNDPARYPSRTSLSPANHNQPTESAINSSAICVNFTAVRTGRGSRPSLRPNLRSSDCTRRPRDGCAARCSPSRTCRACAARRPGSRPRPRARVCSRTPAPGPSCRPRRSRARH